MRTWIKIHTMLCSCRPVLALCCKRELESMWLCCLDRNQMAVVGVVGLLRKQSKLLPKSIRSEKNKFKWKVNKIEKCIV